MIFRLTEWDSHSIVHIKYYFVYEISDTIISQKTTYKMLGDINSPIPLTKTQ